MPRHALIVVLAFTLLAPAVALPVTPSATPGQALGSAPATGEEQLPPFLARMRRRAAVYSQGVLSFTCTEALLEEDIDAWKGEPNWRRQATYRYLLQPHPRQELVAEYRRVLSKDGVPVREAPAVVQTGSPPPYLWTALLDADHASLFRFEIIGTERRGIADTVVVRFEGQLAYQDGQRLGEWSGRLWVDRDRLDVIHLEAEPARQEAAIAIRIDKYRRAFRLAGLPLRKKPRGYTLSIDFLSHHSSGLNFPSRSIWRRQVIDVNGHRGTERMLQRLFSDYGVFDIETDERIKSLEQDGNTDSRPAKTP